MCKARVVWDAAKGEQAVAPEVQQSGIIVLAIFLAVMAERGGQWMRRRAARRWPLAEGRVERAEWRQPNGGTNRYFVADLAYSYVVGGQYFAGYYRRSFSDAESAAEFVRAVKDCRVQVRYRRGESGTSLLLEENLAEAVGAAAEVAS
jgi:uncharacterized protein DUF3592